MSRRAEGLSPAVLALLALLVALPLLADPAKDYLQGLRAFRSGDFATAVAAFRAAVAEDPKEGAQKLRTTGVVFEDYFPHAYLGLALEKAGDPTAARAALEESERQGRATKSPALGPLVEAALVRLRTKPPGTAIPVAIPPPPSATPTSRAVETPTPLPPPPTTVVPAPLVAPTATQLPALPAPPLAVQRGLELFLRARFEEALAALAPEKARSPKARLVHALARAGRALLDAEPDAREVSAARADYRAALAAGARLRRDLVSPRILALIEAGDPERKP